MSSGSWMHFLRCCLSDGNSAKWFRNFKTRQKGNKIASTERCWWYDWTRAGNIWELFEFANSFFLIRSFHRTWWLSGRKFIEIAGRLCQENQSVKRRQTMTGGHGSFAHYRFAIITTRTHCHCISAPLTVDVLADCTTITSVTTKSAFWGWNNYCQCTVHTVCKRAKMGHGVNFVPWEPLKCTHCAALQYSTWRERNC